MKSFRGTKKSAKKKTTDERKLLIDPQVKNTFYVQETGIEERDADIVNTQRHTLRRRSSLPDISTTNKPQPPTRKISEVISMTPKPQRHKMLDVPLRKNNGNGSLSFSYNSVIPGSPPSSPSSPTSPKIPSSPTLPKRPSSPTLPKRPSSPTLPKRQSSNELPKVEYEKLPFNFYVKNKWPWRDITTLIPLLIAGSLFVPSFIVLVVMIIVAKKDAKGVPAHRRKNVVCCAVVLTLSIIRDIILAIVVVCLIYKIPLPSPVLGYPMFLFFWLLCLDMTLLAFYISEAKYSLKYNTIKDNKNQVLKHFNYGEVKEAEFSKIEAEEKYFIDHYPLLSSVSTWTDEYRYMKSVLPRKKVFIALVICVIVCIARFLLVLGLEISPPPMQHVASNASFGLNVTDSHIPQRRALKLYMPCLVASSVVSLLLSLLVSAFMMYALLWSMAILLEWRYFNANERDDKKTVINRGPQAIAMWWKIRETLCLFSSYSICWSVSIGRLLFASSAILVVLMSISLMMLTRKNITHVRRSTFISLVVDNILLNVFLLLQCTLYNLIQKERFLSAQALQLKKLNIAYEIACFGNLTQEHAERESTVRSRSRLLRGKLSLLQDLLHTVIHADADTLTLRVVNISTFIAGCAAVTGMVYSLR